MKIIFILSAFALISCGQASDTTTATAHEPLPDSAVVQSLKDAWLYGFPLVVMHATRQVMTNVTVPFNKGRLLAPVNQLVSASRFPDAKFRDVVRPNCDTYYSVAWMDLGKEPMVLHLPDTHDRYDLFPLLDAWTNVFFCPGKRTTGTKAQTYLITAPGWEGQIPDNMQQVKSPTRMIWMIGRIQVNSAADGNTVVKKIQEGCYLVPLSAYGKPYTAPLGKRDSTLKAKAPNEIVLEMNAADYFNLLNKLLKENPPQPPIP